MSFLDGWKAHDAGVAEAREAVAARRETERADMRDRAVAERVLRQNLDAADYHQGARMLARHLDNLPGAERAQIETGTTSDGTLLLNDPVEVLRLAERVLGPMPTTPEQARQELQDLRLRMRTDPNWHSDDRAQLRYRRILKTFPEITP